MIAGIDFSTKSVNVILLDDDSDSATAHVFDLSPTRFAFDRVRDVVARMPTRGWWEDEGVWLVGIEAPMSRFPHVAKALGLVAGAVLSTLPPAMCVIETQPKEWKRVFGVDASASKEAVAAHARELWCNAPAGLSQDTLDAYAIAYAVRALNDDAIARAS